LLSGVEREPVQVELSKVRVLFELFGFLLRRNRNINVLILNLCWASGSRFSCFMPPPPTALLFRIPLRRELLDCLILAGGFPGESEEFTFNN
jgi:hypothetical protein